MRYQFQDFVLDTEQYRLIRGDQIVAVEPLAFDLLRLLLENRERVVTRDEILDTLWKGKVVSDDALAARLKDARRAAGDSGDRQAVIKTVRGRGYQFVARVDAERPDLRQASIERSGKDVPVPNYPSIAVLPFTVMSADPEQVFFADGVTEDIITALSKISRLFVTARGSAFAYRDKSIDVREVGEELGVEYLLQGSVRKAGRRVRVNAQLTETGDGRHVWAERFDREIDDIFEVQDEITRQIVTALDVELREGEQQRVWSSGTRIFEAWECVRMATEGALGGAADLQPKATELIERALELDPDYAVAWVMRGWLYFTEADVSGGIGGPKDRERAKRKVRECGERAITVDRNCADGFGLLAMYYLDRKNYDEAIAMSEKSVSLAPNNAEMIMNCGVILAKSGEAARGQVLVERAMRLSPYFRPGFLRARAVITRLMGDLETTVACLQASLEKEKGYLAPYVNLASALGELKRTAEAREAAREVLRQKPDFSISDYVGGLSYRDTAAVERIAEGLRAAGLPD